MAGELRDGAAGDAGLGVDDGGANHGHEAAGGGGDREGGGGEVPQVSEGRVVGEWRRTKLSDPRDPPSRYSLLFIAAVRHKLGGMAGRSRRVIRKRRAGMWSGGDPPSCPPGHN